MTDIPPYPGAPRWVKISGSMALALVVLLVTLQLTGIMGRHAPGSPEMQEPPSSTTEDSREDGR